MSDYKRLSMFVAACLGVSVLGCVKGSNGVLATSIEPDTSFVEVDRQLNVYSPAEGTFVTLSIRGELGSPVIPKGYSIQTATPDGALFVLSNADTDMFLYEPGKDASPREVEEVKGLGSAAAISPDRKKVAISLHADYDNPSKSSVEHTDDAIYMVDVETDEVEVIAASRKGWVLQLSWTEQDVLHMHWREPGQSVHDRGLALDLVSGERRDFEWATVARVVWRATPRECGGEALGSDDMGLYLGSREAPEYLVEVTGRKRGFHDHFATIPSYFFIEDCDHVIFTHDEKVYLHQRSSGVTALLAPGSDPWFFPDRK